MGTRTFMLAGMLAAVLGLGQAAWAQFATMGGQPGPYPDMMAPTGMYPGQNFPGPSPYAPPAFAPAAYAGMGGPAPMGPMQASPAMGMGPMTGMAGGMPPGPGYGGSGYGDYCDDGCGWTNRYFAFGEFLYLRPRNAEVAYAAPINGALVTGPTSPQVQVGPVRVADPDYAPGFRLGGGVFLSPRSAVAVTYTQFDRDTFDAVSLPGNGAVFRSLVSSPNPLAVGANGLDTAATLQTQFQLLDVDYKGLITYSPDLQVAYVIGARYANLEQHFAAGFAPATGFQQVLAESEFDGGGLKLGLEGLKFQSTSQFFVYGKGYTSLIAGTFRARYQFDNAGTNVTDTSFRAGRLVTMLDLEAGLGWQSYTGNLRLSMGYMFSAWYNTVKVNEFINAVQNNNFVDPSTNFNGLITFDGLTSRIELLW
jgi:major outer membrane protein